MKRYLPIKIHSIIFGKGWWWGSKFFFFNECVIIPSWFHYRYCQKMSGETIVNDFPESWHKSNDKYRER